MRRATTIIVLAVAGVLMTAGTVFAQTSNPSDGIEGVAGAGGAAGAGVGGTAATGGDFIAAALAIVALVVAGLVALFIARRSSLREDAS